MLVLESLCGCSKPAVASGKFSFFFFRCVFFSILDVGWQSQVAFMFLPATSVVLETCL